MSQAQGSVESWTSSLPLPISQLHIVRSSELAPVEHAVHVSALDAATAELAFPATHSRQSDEPEEPETVEYRPATQLTHAEALVAALAYFPASHDTMEGREGGEWLSYPEFGAVRGGPSPPASGCQPLRSCRRTGGVCWGLAGVGQWRE